MFYLCFSPGLAIKMLVLLTNQVKPMAEPQALRAALESPHRWEAQLFCGALTEL